MTVYSFHYSQTEFRRVTVVADTAEEAYRKYLEGDGDDEFASEGGDQRLLAVDEHDTGEVFHCLWPSDRDDALTVALDRLIRKV